jgi:beta-xylosidase
VDKFHNGAQPIDAFVFADTDGTHYHDLRRLAPLQRREAQRRLSPDSSRTPTARRSRRSRQRLRRGSWMFVKDGKYYFMWSEGGWTGPNYAVAYAIGSSPLGPFERAGKILQQDPAVATGAGHHSVLRAPRSEQVVHRLSPASPRRDRSQSSCRLHRRDEVRSRRIDPAGEDLVRRVAADALPK